MSLLWSTLSLAHNDMSMVLPKDIISLRNLRYLELGGNPNLDRWGLYTILNGLVHLVCVCGDWSGTMEDDDNGDDNHSNSNHNNDSFLSWHQLWGNLADPVPEECTCSGK